MLNSINLSGAPRIGQPGAPPPGYRGPSRGNASGSGSQTQVANPLLRMGVPPPRGGPSIPHGTSSNSSSPMQNAMGMVRKLDEHLKKMPLSLFLTYLVN